MCFRYGSMSSKMISLVGWDGKQGEPCLKKAKVYSFLAAFQTRFYIILFFFLLQISLSIVSITKQTCLLKSANLVQPIFRSRKSYFTLSLIISFANDKENILGSTLPQIFHLWELMKVWSLLDYRKGDWKWL